MRKQRNSGITLIALVITIIVLLILAGVSLSLVAGENGILKRATNAVDKNTIVSGKEETELLVSDLGVEFYEEKYVNGKQNLEPIDSFIQSKFGGTQQTQSGFTATIEENQTVKVSKNGKPLAQGTLQNGKIIWDEEIPAPVDERALTKQVKAQNYGEAVNYSVTIENEVLNNWKIFYNDTQKGVVSIIYGEYLPNSTKLAQKAGLGEAEQPYGVYSISGDANDLVEKMSSTQNWQDLITSQFQEKGAYAYGTPDLKTWIASWNENEGYDQIEFIEEGNKDRGYGQSNSGSAPSLQGFVVENTNLLYFPFKEGKDGARGYILRTENGYNLMNYATFFGIVGNSSNTTDMEYPSIKDYAIRPVICLPASVLGERIDGVWNIE